MTTVLFIRTQKTGQSKNKNGGQKNESKG